MRNTYLSFSNVSNCFSNISNFQIIVFEKNLEFDLQFFNVKIFRNFENRSLRSDVHKGE